MEAAVDRPPQLSIVIPIYNVILYINDCLESLASLPSADVEFILVDDGSTDGSFEFAQKKTHEDHRFKLLQANRVGPGEARNIGVRHARGEFLGFLDGDDVIIPKGYWRGFQLLRQSKADFITCAFRRLKKNRTPRSKLCKGHITAKKPIQIEGNPDLIFASVLWNKIFRKGFFWDTCYPIPDGIFEDLLPNLKAFSLTKKFVVSSSTAVLWRYRDDKSSFTQRKYDTQNIIDRTNAIDACLTFLTDRPEKHKEIFIRKVICHDAPLILEGSRREHPQEVRDAVVSIFNRLICDLKSKPLPPEVQTPLENIQKYISGHAKRESE